MLVLGIALVDWIIVDCSIVAVFEVVVVDHSFVQTTLWRVDKLDLPIVLSVLLEGVPQVVQMVYRFGCWQLLQ